MYKPTPCVLALSFLLLATVPALAQYPEIREGEPQGGTLTTSDATTGDGAFADGYLYRGRSGERLSISLQSADFDAYVWFARLSEAMEPLDLTGNDDGAGGTDALIEVDLDQDGQYVILASAYSEGQTGAYRLSVDASPGAAPVASTNPRGAAIVLGVPTVGRLEPGDLLLSDGSYYDLHTFSGSAGQQIEVTLRSRDFDAYLTLGSWSDGTLTVSDRDDDAGGGTDSRVRMTIPQDGVYGIRANTLFEGNTGGYSLLVTASQVPAITAGEAVSADLASGDGSLEDRSHYDDYLYRAEAGENLTIDLEAEDFDPFLMLMRVESGAVVTVESNDDVDGGLNSRVQYSVPASGEYLVRATSLNGSQEGAYRLRVHSAR